MEVHDKENGDLPSAQNRNRSVPCTCSWNRCRSRCLSCRTGQSRRGRGMTGEKLGFRLITWCTSANNRNILSWIIRLGTSAHETEPSSCSWKTKCKFLLNIFESFTAALQPSAHVSSALSAGGLFMVFKRRPALTPHLALPFGHVINSRSPQLKETLLPGLLAIFFEVQHRLQIRHDYGSSAEVLLRREWKNERGHWEEPPGGKKFYTYAAYHTCISNSLSLSFMSLRAFLSFFQR